jgi:hypothetical protein
MGKRRNLNGLPNSLTQRYFSTLFYYDGGYMADWIWASAEKAGVKELKIDILNKTVLPEDIDIEPLTAHLDKLQDTIKTTLEQNGFGNQFIRTAYFNICISQRFKTERLLTCTAVLTDQDGKEYQGRTYTEKSYEDTSPVMTFLYRLKKKIGLD